MDDGLHCLETDEWESPTYTAGGHSLPSLLVVRGPMDTIDTAIVGNARGEVLVFTLPSVGNDFKIRYWTADASERYRSIDQGSLNLLAGTQKGSVWCT